MKLFASILLITGLFFLSFWAQSQSDEVEFMSQIQSLKESNDSLNLSRTYYKYAKFLSETGEKEKCRNYLIKSLELNEKLMYPAGIATVSNYLACEYSEVGFSDSAIFYFERSLKTANEMEDSLRIESALLNIGDQYNSMGNYDQAIDYCLRAIRIKEKRNSESDLAFYYQKLGEIFKSVGNYSKWSDYIYQAYSLMMNDEKVRLSTRFSIYNDLGGLAEYNGDLDRALQYYDTILQLSSDKENSKARFVALNNSSTIYKSQGNIKEAIDLAQKALPFLPEESYQQIYYNNHMGELLLSDHQPEKALVFLNRNKDNPSLSDFADENYRLYDLMYRSYEELGKYQFALDWLKQSQQLHDSLRNNALLSRVSELELQYQTEKRENRIKELQSDQKIQEQQYKIAVTIIISLILLILTVVYIFLLQRKNAKYKIGEVQQQLLRSQMNPHFLFNALSSIQGFMQLNNSEKASIYLGKFASLTRNVLEYSAEENISLSAEIETLKDYLDLEKMRAENAFEYQIEMNGEIESEFIQIPPMLIQPFVENAVKHGLKQIEKGGHILLSFAILNDNVQVLIIDNGMGISGGLQPKAHRSMAIEIFKKRQKLFKKKYGRSIQLYFRTPENGAGTQVEILIPIRDI